MVTSVPVIAALLLQVLLGAAGATLGAAWARRRLADAQGRRFDRLEARLSGLDSTLRRIESALAGPSAPEDRDARGVGRGPRSRSAYRPIGLPRPPREARFATDAPGPTLIAVPDLSGPGRAVGSQAESAHRASAAADLARRFTQVWSMADRGASADRIALATGQPIGQVELVLNLRRRLLDEPSAEVPA